MQKLILPINDLRLTAAYKNKAYQQFFGFAHYGIDCTSYTGYTALYGLGAGKVIAAGLDGATGPKSGLGNVVVVQYPSCYVHYMGAKAAETRDLICTYFHLRDEPLVKAGDVVTPKTLLGYYGNTGGTTTGAHLHIQFDTDTEYPLFCAGISAKNSLILHAGTVDSTLDPLDVLHLGSGQSIKSNVDKKYYEGESFDLPYAEADTTDWQALYKSEKAAHDALKDALKALVK